ncbi:MAG: DUF4397 domain-containing protein [Burkholderiales bacterium]
MRRKLLLALPVALMLVAAGCKVDTINYFPPHPANVRVINLMADAPSIDVQVGGSPAFSGVAFQAATGYQSFNNQTTSFAVFVSGSTTPLTTFSAPLAGEQPYTLIVFGSQQYPGASLFSEVAKAPTNGNIQFTVFNAAINNGFIDVYVTTPGADITQLNPNFGNISYNGVALNLAFAPGTYQIQVTPSGTKTVIYDSGGTALTPNIALAFIAYSKGSGTLANAAVIQSQGPTGLLNNVFTRLKVMNSASSVAAVNVTQGAFSVATNVGYGSASTYTQGPQGPTVVNYEASATPGAVIASVSTTLGAGTDNSTFIVGLPGSQQAYVLQDQNLLPAQGSIVRLRFVNASWNSNPVNVSINNTPLASNVAFPNASAYVQFPAGTYAITFTDAVTGDVVLTADSGALVAGHTSTVYMIGPAGALGSVVTQDY